MHVDLVVVAFLCATIVIIPLPWYWRARNVSIISVIFWLFTYNLIRGVNAIVWGDDVIVRTPVWCDISTKLMIGAPMGLTSAMLCVCRFLAQVASPHHKLQSAGDRRRRKIFELVMCVAVPLVFMALHYIVQGHRFDIIEGLGCQPNIYTSVPALFLFYFPPLIAASVAMVYAAIALRWFVHRRKQFQAVLQSSQSGLTTGRYLRLIALAFVEMNLLVGITLFTLVNNIGNGGLRPWVSWEFVHDEWLRVGQVAKILIPADAWQAALIFWWFVPIASIIFFAFFGFGQEANAEYRKAYRWVKTNIFRIEPQATSVLPVSARMGGATLNSMATTPTIIKLETETTVSGVDKWDDVPASTHTTSRPESPERKDIESQVRS